MAISDALMRAILAMDSYNRGYNAGINILPSVVDTQIGYATLINTSTIAMGGGADSAIGFYAAAYQLSGGEKVISIRGTDNFGGAPTIGGDIWYGYGVGLGSPAGKQAEMAFNFYNAVAGVGTGPDTANISLTGHSLGGGLAGLVAAVYNRPGVLFDNMAFELAAQNTRIQSVEALATAAGQTYNAALKNTVYGTATPWAIDFSRLQTHYVVGEFLEANRVGQIYTPKTPHIIGTGVDIVQGFGPIDLHSMATLAIGMFAETFSTQQKANFDHVALDMWGALYDNTFAKNIGMGTIPGRYLTEAQAVSNLENADGYSTILRSIIAYSAIDNGANTTAARPFGDVAIRAMYDDANQLGAIIKASGDIPGSISQTLLDSVTAISKSFVQFAGQMALNKTLKSPNSAALEGVLAISPDNKFLTLDFRESYWKTGNSGAVINMVARNELIDELLDDTQQKANIIDGMGASWGSLPINNIEKVIFATTGTNINNAYTMDVGSNTQKVITYIGGDGVDTITGSLNNDLILGGNGNDVFLGSVGRDVIIGGDGNDTLDFSSYLDGVYINSEKMHESNSALDRIIAQPRENPNVDTIYAYQVENITGTNYDDYIDGTRSNNVIKGGWGDDYLIGGFGDDIINPGRGFYDHSSGDWGGYSAVLGTDTLDLSDYNIALNLELEGDFLTYQASSGEGGTADGFERYILGSGNDVFEGKFQYNSSNQVWGVHVATGNGFVDMGGGTDKISLRDKTIIIEDGKIFTQSGLEVVNAEHLETKYRSDQDPNYIFVKTLGIDISDVSQDYEWINADPRSGNYVSYELYAGPLTINVSQSSGTVSNGVLTDSVSNIGIIGTNHGDTITFDGISVISGTGNDIINVNNSHYEDAGSLTYTGGIDVVQDASLLRSFVLGYGILPGQVSFTEINKTYVKNNPYAGVMNFDLRLDVAGHGSVTLQGLSKPTIYSNDLPYVSSGNHNGPYIQFWDLRGVSSSIQGTYSVGGEAWYLSPLNYNTIGNDTVVSSYIETGFGNDIIFADVDPLYSGRGYFRAGAGNDTVYGSRATDHILAESGDDIIYGEDGNDFISGGSGNDFISGGKGNDTLSGDDGDDVYVWGAGYGIDTITDFQGTNSIHVVGYNKNQLVINPQDTAHYGSYTITAGNDVLILAGEWYVPAAHSYAYSPIRTISFDNGEVLNFEDWQLVPDAEAPVMSNVISGGAINESLTGTFASEFIKGEGGNDTLLGMGGDDRLEGGTGNDSLNGGDGDDFLDGGTGDDLFIGSSGNDYVLGGDGLDVLNLSSFDNVRIDLQNGGYVSGNGQSSGYYREIEEIVLKTGSQNSISINGETVRVSADGLYHFASGALIKNLSIYNLNGAVAHSSTHYEADREVVITSLGRQYNIEGEYTLNYSKIAHSVSYNSMTKAISGASGTDTFSGVADFVGSNHGDVINLGNYFNKVWTGKGNDQIRVDASAFHGAGTTAGTIIYTGGHDVITGDVSGGWRLMFTSGITPADISLSTVNSEPVHWYMDSGIGGWQTSLNLVDLVINISGHGTITLPNVEARRQAGSDRTLNTADDIITYGQAYYIAVDPQERGVVPQQIQFWDGRYITASSNYTVNGISTYRNPSTPLDDLIDAPASTHTIHGGFGDDTYVYTVGDGIDYLYEPAGQGYDTIRLIGLLPSQVNVTVNSTQYIVITNTQNAGDGIYIRSNATLGAGGAIINDHVERILFDDGTIIYLDGSPPSINGTSGNDNLSGTANADVINGYGGDDLLNGLNGDDTLNGHGGNDYLYGAGGNDYLYGGEGDDTLDGAVGADLMVGGSGNDVYFIDNIGDVVVEVAGGGSDTVWTSISYVAAAEIENLRVYDGTNINITGNSGNNNIWGNGGSNILAGAAGNDTLYGLGGNDTLNGGTGDDVYVFNVGDGADLITENASEGMDTIRLIGLTAAQISVVRTSSGNIQISNTLNSGDLITINANATINGGVITNDRVERILLDNGTVIYLDGTSPSINGTSGNDNLSGTANADVINGYGGDDLLNGLNGDDTLNGHGGNDYLYGAGGNDYLYGDEGDDTLDGASGADTMYGGSGNDVYFIDNIGDVVVELAGSGSDTVWTSISYIATAEIENLRVYDGTNINITGNGGNNNVWGNAGSNVLAGADGNDTLYGLDGNDTLIGDAGSDTLHGGIGADTFKFAVSTVGSIDTIADFSVSQGDKIDVKDLLFGYDPLTSLIENFVEMTNSGSNTVLRVDRDGAGTGHSWQQIATLNNVTGLTDEAALVTSGNLIV